MNKKVSDIVYHLHRQHVDSELTSPIKNIYNTAVAVNWMKNLVYKIDSHLIVFNPMRCKRPEQSENSAYCLGSLYYGSYYLVTPEQITAKNLGAETIIFSDDYSTYEDISLSETIEPFIISLCL